jgi:GTP-binding protein EngB required for normal cell division
MASLNEPQKRAVLCGFLDIHRRMAELETLLVPEARPSPFSQHVNDLSPTEAKVVGDYFARIRTAMLAHLRECDIPLDVRPTSRRWALQCGISFVGITIDEMRPEKLRGYGDLDEAERARVLKIHDDLERLIDRVGAYVRQGQGRDLAQRLARLDASPASRDTLDALERITSRWRLVEFRPALDMIVGRIESPSFEVAVFGRVSSGKSSLLNHIAGTDVLPVGVTPVTAVPTRIAYGEKPAVVVSFAESGPRSVPVDQLREYASEEGNPGNGKHVTGILVRLPSPRLKDGVIFVDTPGIGSLALAGAAESLAYLPRCDLGIVLVDAGSTLNQEDLTLLRALYGAGVPAMVLLSKADLLAPGDRERMVGYIGEQFRRELGVELPVHPVSIVGADESLLNRWFDEELTPLLDRHRSLAEASIRRKIAHLRESVIAVLETLRAKQRGGRGEEGVRIDSGAAQRLLDDTDEAIRQARGRALGWSDGRRALPETISRAAAERFVSDKDAAGDGTLARTIEGALARHGREAHELVANLQRTLAETLDALGRVAPVANAESAAIRDYHAGGLPVPDLNRLVADSSSFRPWWVGLAPTLAVRATERAIQERLGPEITDVVEFYDRQLEGWLKANVARVVELYEAQATAFREQLRRLAAPDGEPGAAGDAADLESDLRTLREVEDDEPGRVAASVDGDGRGVRR